MRFITILFTLSLVSALSHTAKGQGFSLSPSRLFFTGNPGETVTQTITFGNATKNDITYVTRIQDFDRDSTGTKIYYDPNTRPSSNASWISFSTSSIVVPAGGNKQVIVSLNIPAGSKKLVNSMIFFTQVNEQTVARNQVKKIGINVLIEMGVQVYYTPNGLSAGDFEYLAFNDLGIYDDGRAKSRRLALKVHNNGEINKDAFVRFELTNKETGEEIKIKPETLAMLPGATQWIYVDLPLDLKGNYLVVALLDAGSTYDLKVAEKEITYRP